MVDTTSESKFEKPYFVIDYNAPVTTDQSTIHYCICFPDDNPFNKKGMTLFTLIGFVSTNLCGFIH